MARGDTALRSSPVPRGLATRSGGRLRMAPLVRVPRTLPKIWAPSEADVLMSSLRRHRDRAIVLAMLLVGLSL